MGGFFGAVSRKNCKYDVFFGTDYHSHLGTKRGGMAFWDEEKGFQRQIHNIENTPFRTKFEGDLKKLDGTVGVGCISDTDPQPLLVRSHLVCSPSQQLASSIMLKNWLKTPSMVPDISSWPCLPVKSTPPS